MQVCFRRTESTDKTDFCIGGWLPRKNILKHRIWKLIEDYLKRKVDAGADYIVTTNVLRQPKLL